MTVKCLWEVGCLLGESPVWDAAAKCLWFVDIKAHHIYVWSESGVKQAFEVSGEIGSVVLRESGGLLAVIDQALAYIETAPFAERGIALDFAEPANNRFNDGKCDPAGRFWVASMDNACRLPSGRIWRIEKDLTHQCMAEGHIVGNGFGWSPDNSRMYFTDSENRRILVYPYRIENGGLGEPEVFVEVPEGQGLPDGLAVDAMGFVWSAHWDGWRVTRYTPGGDVDRVVELPVPRPTSLAFGGEDLERLFVTSASMELSDEQCRQAPLSGSLFEIAPGVSGLPVRGFAG